MTWEEFQHKARPVDGSHIPFSWKPPDLTEGGKWHSARTKNLLDGAGSFEDPTSVIDKGLEALRIHRQNYKANGPDPKQLQLLWWEFPKEHWEPLKNGSRMNFLKQPEAKIHDNANMDDEQIQVAVGFVEELLDLGVIRTPLEGHEILTNAPLFVVPKEGQDGEWRVIADML
jgi:hypothetical protein